MPFPVAHGLLGATVVVSLHPSAVPNRDWKPLLCGVILSLCPDFDYFFEWILHWTHGHRAFTHSVAFAVVVGSAMVLLMGRARRREAMAYSLALLSHTLLDFSTTKINEGVQLLWPFSKELYRLGLLGFSEFEGGFETPYMLLARLNDVLLASVIELIVFLPVFLAVLMIRQKAYVGCTVNRM